MPARDRSRAAAGYDETTGDPPREEPIVGWVSHGLTAARAA